MFDAWEKFRKSRRWTLFYTMTVGGTEYSLLQRGRVNITERCDIYRNELGEYRMDVTHPGMLSQSAVMKYRIKYNPKVRVLTR